MPQPPGRWLLGHPVKPGDDGRRRVLTLRNTNKRSNHSRLSRHRQSKPDSYGLDPAIHAICLSISLRGQWNGCPDQGPGMRKIEGVVTTRTAVRAHTFRRGLGFRSGIVCPNTVPGLTRRHPGAGRDPSGVQPAGPWQVELGPSRWLQKPLAVAAPRGRRAWIPACAGMTAVRNGRRSNPGRHCAKAGLHLSLPHDGDHPIGAQVSRAALSRGTGRGFGAQ